MDRVGKLEKDVAVIENRLDTAEAEISIVRQEIGKLSSKMDRATGMIMAGMLVLQIVGILLSGGGWLTV